MLLTSTFIGPRCQVFFSAWVFAAILIMVSTSLTAAALDSPADHAYDRVPPFNPAKIVNIVSSGLFAQMCHQGVPSVVRMTKDKQVRLALSRSFALTLALMLLDVSLSLSLSSFLLSLWLFLFLPPSLSLSVFPPPAPSLPLLFILLVHVIVSRLVVHPTLTYAIVYSLQQSKRVFYYSLAYTLVLYSLLGFSTSFHLGPATNPIITLNWNDFRVPCTILRIP